MRVALGILCSGFLLLGAARAQEKDTRQSPQTVAIDIKNAQGQIVGKAAFSRTDPRGIKLDLDIKNLPPGDHAFHIHQKPICDASEEFDTAGLQYDPTGEMYGNADHKAHSGPSAGDPRTTIKIGADGTGHATVIFPALTLGNDSQSVFANGGTAIMFHAAAGASGPTRIACGVIVRPK